MKALTYMEQGRFALTEKPKGIEEAHPIFENKLDGVIKIAIEP